MPRGNPTFLWNEEHDNLLTELVKEGIPARLIAERIGGTCTPDHVYRRCHVLGLESKDTRRRGRPIGLTDKPQWSASQIGAMHTAFARAMIAAVKKGAERTPFGVVKSPGTSRAIYVPGIPVALTQSVAADVAALGAYTR